MPRPGPARDSRPPQIDAEDISGEIVIDRPPHDSGEEPAVAPPAASRGGVVTSDGAGSAVASSEIKSAPSADPSAPSSVLLEAPEVAAEPVVALDFGTTRSSVAILVTMTVRHSLAQNLFWAPSLFWRFNPRDPDEWLDNDVPALAAFLLAALDAL